MASEASERERTGVVAIIRGLDLEDGSTNAASSLGV